MSTNSNNKFTPGFMPQQMIFAQLNTVQELVRMFNVHNSAITSVLKYSRYK